MWTMGVLCMFILKRIVNRLADSGNSDMFRTERSIELLRKTINLSVCQPSDIMSLIDIPGKTKYGEVQIRIATPTQYFWVHWDSDLAN
jgi:hypothetical protein